MYFFTFNRLNVIITLFGEREELPTSSSIWRWLRNNHCQALLFVSLALSFSDEKSICFPWKTLHFHVASSRLQSLMMWQVYLIVLLWTNTVIIGFSPDTSDFDAYGVKVAANNVLFVQAKSKVATFLVQYAPYNVTFDSLQCTVEYDDSTHYVYSVGVGSKQNSTNNTYFYFSGEVASDRPSGTDRLGRSGIFISLWINRDPQDILSYSANRRFLPCDFFRVDTLQFLSAYDHQDYFVMAVEPYGQYALGFATDFAFRYQPFTLPRMTTLNATFVWPNSSTFYPCAADASDTFTVVAGFVESSARSRVRATPIVYLMLNNLTIVSSWSYTASNNSWQSRLTYSTVSSWSKANTMSVKINMDDKSRVLVGMPFLNTVFMFVVNATSMSLQMVSSRSNGQAVGFGKSVTWLASDQAAILVSTYSSDYQTWLSSKVFVYTSLTGTDVPSTATAVLPNSQQPLPSTISSEWIRIVSTPESVAVLDVNGGAMLILSEQPGSYASTDTTNSPVAAAMPVVSHSTACIGGTYKTDTGVHPCVICPSGTRNPGGLPALSCLNCSSSNFCPLGALYEMNGTVLVPESQAFAYPRTPDMDVFEDILLNSMFSFGSTLHCLRVSPIFWTMILLSIILMMLLAMASLNFCMQQEKRDLWRTNIKSVFLRTDLVVSRTTCP